MCFYSTTKSDTPDAKLQACQFAATGAISSPSPSHRPQVRRRAGVTPCAIIALSGLLLWTSGCGESEASKAARAATEARTKAFARKWAPLIEQREAEAKALAEAYAKKLAQFSDESMQTMPADELKSLILNAFDESPTYSGPTTIYYLALSGIRLLPQEDRDEVWTKRGVVITGLLESESAHKSLHLENRVLERNHLGYLITNKCVNALAEAAPCEAAVPLMKSILHDYNLRAGNSDVASQAVGYLKRLNSPASREVLQGLLDSSDTVPRPFADFLPLAADAFGIDGVDARLRQMTEPAYKLLDVVYFLRSAVRQIERETGMLTSTYIQHDDPVSTKIKLDTMDMLIDLRTDTLTTLLGTPPGENEITVRITGVMGFGGPSAANEPIDLATADAATRVKVFNRIMGRLELSASDSLRADIWAERSVGQLLELYQAFSDRTDAYVLPVLFDGLNVRNQQVSVAASAKLKQLIGPEEFSETFFAYLATRSEYSLSEVETYIQFLTGHCSEHPGAVARAMSQEVERAGGDVEAVSWIKKFIGLRALKDIATTSDLAAIEPFLADTSTFSETTVHEDDVVLREESETIAFSNLAKEAMTEIRKRNAK